MRSEQDAIVIANIESERDVFRIALGDALHEMMHCNYGNATQILRIALTYHPMHLEEYPGYREFQSGGRRLRQEGAPDGDS